LARSHPFHLCSFLPSGRCRQGFQLCSGSPVLFYGGEIFSARIAPLHQLPRTTTTLPSSSAARRVVSSRWMP
jgi:hypothetical protein